MSKQYLFRINIFSKKNSHPLETISYYSGQNQYDGINGKTYNSNTKDNVVWNNIEIPNKETALKQFIELPEYLKFRSLTPKRDMIENARNILWQQVAARENRNDAQLSRMFEVAIPSFISTSDAIDVLKKFAQVLVNDGLIADCALHVRNNILSVSLMDRMRGGMEDGMGETENDAKSNKSSFYQGFIVCPLRMYEDGQFTNKNREWNQFHKLQQWRYAWVEILAEKIMNYEISDSERDSWEEKMSIYDEYKEIKEKLSVGVKEKESRLKM